MLLILLRLEEWSQFKRQTLHTYCTEFLYFPVMLMNTT